MIPQHRSRQKSLLRWSHVTAIVVIVFIGASWTMDVTKFYDVSIRVEETGSPEVITLGSFSQQERPLKTAAPETGWWTPFGNSIARVWHDVNVDHHPKCFPINRSIWKDIPAHGDEVRGLIYIKSHKASSSTAEGVNLALAHHWIPTPSSKLKCEHYNRHIFANQKWHARRNRTASLLWTLVRHPRARDVSHVYHFRVSRQGMDPQSPAFWTALRRQKSTQVNYLGVTSFPQGNRSKGDNLVGWIQTKIMEEYDFIGVTERMTTSLAVMSLLWHIDPSHLVVLSAKQSQRGSYDAGGRRKICTKLVAPPNPIPDQLSNFLNSPSYLLENWDFVLYHAVNKSLDITIEKLGKERVEKQAALLDHLQQLAETECRPKAVFPCSQDGTYQEDISNCYIQDSGCGYECVDEVMRGYNRNGGEAN